MKVVVMVDRFNPEIGGVEVTAEVISRGLIERHGWDVTIVTHTTARSADEETFPFKVLREPSPSELVRVIRESDVVFHNNPCLKFSWPQLFIKRPWLVALRMWISMPGLEMTPVQKIRYKAKYEIVESADKLVANSSVLAAHVRPEVEVIHNSYRDSIFKELDGTPRPRSSFVYLGRLSDDKGIDLLLSSIAALKHNGLAPTLTIIGEGPYQKGIEDLVRQLDLGDEVTLVGKLTGSDINAELNKHRIAVVPSRMPEPFGTVALETSAAGCVTVVANHGGLPEAIGDAGPKFTPHDEESLTRVLTRLVTDDEYFEGYRSAIKDHVDAHRESVMVDRFDAALRETIDIFNRKNK